MTELKPRPFCGGQADIYTKTTGTVRKHPITGFNVGCGKCHMYFGGVVEYYYGANSVVIHEDGLAEAIKRWNNRAEVTNDV